MTAKTFTNTAGGNWNVGSNWTMPGVPAGTDDAFINDPGTYTVTLSDVEAPHSITLDNADATLSVTSNAKVLGSPIALDAGTFALGGLVLGSTITSAGAAFTPSAGVLSGVVWKGPLIGAGMGRTDPGGDFGSDMATMVAEALRARIRGRSNPRVVRARWARSE